MTLCKTERIFSPPPAQGARARHLAVAALAVIGAAPVLLLLCLVPRPLALPVLSIVSFAVAGVVALIAHYCRIDRRAPGVSAWDIVAVFTLIWIGAGMMSGAKPIVELFDRLAMTP
ncbi:MAG TPA: hypothetical protein VKC66_16560 [Xanthobacteraceae bacterium]|nr:hypothetical protein [Xanthobacteraceae bacterium]